MRNELLSICLCCPPYSRYHFRASRRPRGVYTRDCPRIQLAYLTGQSALLGNEHVECRAHRASPSCVRRRHDCLRLTRPFRLQRSRKSTIYMLLWVFGTLPLFILIGMLQIADQCLYNALDRSKVDREYLVRWCKSLSTYVEGTYSAFSRQPGFASRCLKSTTMGPRSSALLQHPFSPVCYTPNFLLSPRIPLIMVSP